ncbi:MAG: hypothetical protein WA765_21485 [Candidatus Acidiferrum sp.]
MAIRFKLRTDGTIESVEVDSVDEAIAYQEQVKHSGARATNSYAAAPPAPTGASTKEDLEPLPTAAHRLVKLLFEQKDGLDTAQIGSALGVESKGVGGSVTSLTSWGRRYGLGKKQLLTKMRRTNDQGRSVRRIALSYKFRKMIDEGIVNLESKG